MRCLIRPSLALLVVLGLLPATTHAQLQFCETYIAITEHPPSPYYYGTTADITVVYGDIETDPQCIGYGGSDPSSFQFTVNGVNRTNYFNVEWGMAIGTAPAHRTRRRRNGRPLCGRALGARPLALKG